MNLKHGIKKNKKGRGFAAALPLLTALAPVAVHTAKYFIDKSRKKHNLDAEGKGAAVPHPYVGGMVPTPYVGGKIKKLKMRGKGCACKM